MNISGLYCSKTGYLHSFDSKEVTEQAVTENFPDKPAIASEMFKMYNVFKFNDVAKIKDERAVIIHMVHLAMVNAYILYQQNPHINPISYLSFIHSVALSWKGTASCKYRYKSTRNVNILRSNARIGMHIPFQLSVNCLTGRTPRRTCAVCKKDCNTGCSGCKVSVHLANSDDNRSQLSCWAQIHCEGYHMYVSYTNELYNDFK